MKKKKRIRKPLESCSSCAKQRVLGYRIFMVSRANPHLKGGFRVCQTCYRKTPKLRRL